MGDILAYLNDAATLRGVTTKELLNQLGKHISGEENACSTDVISDAISDRAQVFHMNHLRLTRYNELSVKDIQCVNRFACNYSEHLINDDFWEDVTYLLCDDDTMQAIVIDILRKRARVLTELSYLVMCRLLPQAKEAQQRGGALLLFSKGMTGISFLYAHLLLCRVLRQMLENLQLPDELFSHVLHTMSDSELASNVFSQVTEVTKFSKWAIGGSAWAVKCITNSSEARYASTIHQVQQMSVLRTGEYIVHRANQRSDTTYSCKRRSLVIGDVYNVSLSTEKDKLVAAHLEQDISVVVCAFLPSDTPLVDLHEKFVLHRSDIELFTSKLNLVLTDDGYDIRALRFPDSTLGTLKLFSPVLVRKEEVVHPSSFSITLKLNEVEVTIGDATHVCIELETVLARMQHDAQITLDTNLVNKKWAGLQFKRGRSVSAILRRVDRFCKYMERVVANRRKNGSARSSAEALASCNVIHIVN